MDEDRGRYADIAGGFHEGLDSSWRSSSDPGEGLSGAEAGGAPQPATRRAVGHHRYFIDGAEAFAAVAADPWLDIASARVGRRVVVGGSRLKEDGVGSYWWQDDDAIGPDGRPVKHPTATHWRRRNELSQR
jgi:hypothetical protein